LELSVQQLEHQMAAYKEDVESQMASVAQLSAAKFKAEEEARKLKESNQVMVYKMRKSQEEVGVMVPSREIGPVDQRCA